MKKLHKHQSKTGAQHNAMMHLYEILFSVRWQGSTLAVIPSFPDRPSELQSPAVVLPVSGAILALMKILAAVNRKAGAPVPAYTGKS
jgi:hypothetical protein